MAIRIVNNFTTFLGTALGASTPGTAGQSLVIATGTGSAFPVITAPDVAYLTLVSGSNIEIVRVTAHTANSDTFTVTRGVEGVGNSAPTAVAYALDTSVSCRLTSASLGLLTVDSASFATTSSYATSVQGVGVDGALQVKLNAGSTTGSTALKWDSANAKLDIDGQIELLGYQSNPAAANSGSMSIYARNISGRYMPKWIGPAGVDYFVQPAVWGNNAVWVKPGTGTAVGTALEGVGVSAIAPTGTVTQPNLATTTLGSSIRRTVFTTTAAGSCGWFAPDVAYHRGDAAGRGGFFFFARVRQETAATVAQVRMFVGLTTLATNMCAAEPSAAVGDYIGFGCDAADTNYRIIYRNNTTTVEIDAGIAKVALATFDIWFYCPPGNAQPIYYRIDNVNTGATLIADSHTGIATAAAPRVAQFMRMTASGGSTGTASQGIAINTIYCESDF